MNTPFKVDIEYNKKHFIIFIKINKIDPKNTDYFYDIEIQTKEKLTGNEFQNLKKYLEAEGYINQAIEYYR